MHRIVVLALVLTACTTPIGDPPAPTSGDVPGGAIATQVIGVQDGDSVTLRLAGNIVRVRLIGINAPELDECWGADAMADLARYEGRQVRVTFDVEERDQYDRVLAYLWAGDTLINTELIANGSVFAAAFPPNTAYQDTFDAAEEQARNQGLGVWAGDACGPTINASVEIATINADPDGPDEQHLEDEYISVINRGEAAIDLSGWILRDASTVHRFRFPDGFSLDPGAEITIVSGCGDDTNRVLFWCAEGPVWNNAGDEATLMTPNGSIVDHVEY